MTSVTDSAMRVVSRASLAVMPSTQFTCSVWQARAKWVRLLCSAQPISGSKALSCSWPASAAMVMATSLPMTSKQTWFITSGITGLTLPGMMDEPAWRAGSWISPIPACGPEDSRRRSLQILDSLLAMRLRMPEMSTKAPVSAVAAIRLPALVTGTPESSASWGMTTST
ncbi:hypothetical protein D3C71_1702010 [compost metagenome]